MMKPLGTCVCGRTLWPLIAERSECFDPQTLDKIIYEVDMRPFCGNVDCPENKPRIRLERVTLASLLNRKKAAAAAG